MADMAIFRLKVWRVGFIGKCGGRLASVLADSLRGVCVCIWCPFWLDICPSGLKNERDNNAKTLNKILIFYEMVIISKSYQKERYNENGYSQK